MNNKHSTTSTPLLRQLSNQLTPEAAFSRLATWPNCIWFDSAGGPAALARYSFMSADPIQSFTETESHANVLDGLSDTVQWLEQQPHDSRAPFTGGLAGVFGFNLCHALERIPAHRFEDFAFPVLSLGLYDWTIVWDHLLGSVTLWSQGWPETDSVRRIQRAESRLIEVERALATVRPSKFKLQPCADVVTQFQTRVPGVTSNFSSTSYQSAVAELVEYIRAGDVFQVNLAQRLLMRQANSAVDQYLTLRRVNRAPFAGYYDGGGWQVLSSSPERFLKINDRRIETRPIKGTCPRTGDRTRDVQLGQALLASQKNRAENIMIVDLMRNDLSRICTDDSIEVSQLCGLETYTHVQHLVSAVEGCLRSDVNFLDALRCMFPGGSVTGAPKPRALELIAKLEPTPRGAYCGSLGYISCGSSCDLNLLIRTMTAQAGWLQIPVGGGVTARSDPAQEEQETWDKAAGMLAALRIHG